MLSSKPCNLNSIFIGHFCFFLMGDMDSVNIFIMTIKIIVIELSDRLIATMFLAMGLTLEVQAQDTNVNLQATIAAANKGDAKAQYQLGRDLLKGIGVNKDYAKAAQYFRLAADQGYADAEVTLGSLYGRGQGVPINLTNAVLWYRKAAEQGDALAQYVVGNFYYTGRGVTNDFDEAIAWWQKAGAQNQMDAETALGQLYLIPAAPYGTRYLNPAAALPWLRKAADQGSARALNNLGVAYENGLGVKRDFAQAAKWYRAAATRGDAQGQANLGQLYRYGQGVDKDLVEAFVWFKLSSSQGSPLGSVNFSELQTSGLLTPAQLDEAEQRIADFKKQFSAQP
jgi:TPR repeat protein